MAAERLASGKVFQFLAILNCDIVSKVYITKFGNYPVSRKTSAVILGNLNLKYCKHDLISFKDCNFFPCEPFGLYHPSDEHP